MWQDKLLKQRWRLGRLLMHLVLMKLSSEVFYTCLVRCKGRLYLSLDTYACVPAEYVTWMKIIHLVDGVLLRGCRL